MKRLLVIGALLGARTLTARSQTIATMAAQLAEIQSYERTTLAGYQLMTAGLDSIGGIDNTEYRLHANYFASLDVIRSSVADDPVAGALKALQSELSRQIEARLNYWNNLKNQLK